ncbi:MAG: hypothetical protein KDA53_15235 [Hyphomonas sp.]|nr:hypothetical protein [Hyphomonas sp.]
MKRAIWVAFSAALILMVGACAWLPWSWGRAPQQSGFVTVEDGRFALDGRAYAFAGTNVWYGAYLGAPGETGDLTRLARELDLLKANGMTNLRVLGASEESPMKNSLTPAFHGPDNVPNEDLLLGLDRLLAELAQRDMKAVIYLNNFWEWSGGMGTYLSWVNGGEYIDLGDPAHPWPEFPLFNMQFYANEEANAIYRDYVRALVTRRNTVNGRLYAEDPTIMAWQLANEPRPGYSAEPGMAVLPEYYDWVESTAEFIKSFDNRHLVSTGSEGVVGCADHVPCYLDAHRAGAVDYLTFHMWPKNWSWLDGSDMEGSFPRVTANSEAYIAQHIAMAKELGKPIVLEEFGLPRDDGALEPGSPTVLRDRYFAGVFADVEESVAEGGPLMGTNFWTWGGLGRAEHADRAWRAGDRSYTGDPPQEPQGLNSVFSEDASTLAVIRTHAERLAQETAVD